MTTTLSQLRATLAGRGYQETASTPQQQLIAPLITIHTHPLLTSPVVLIGNNADIAIGYQSSAVEEATKRR